MTTIVYSHKLRTISYDSRVTAGGDIISDEHDKMVERDGKKYFIAGNNADIDIFLNEVGNNNQASEGIDVCALMVEGDDVSLVAISSDGRYKINKLQFNEGVGSGCCWALAALDFGKDTKEAVKYAAKKDSRTGGTINTYFLDEKSPT